MKRVLAPIISVLHYLKIFNFLMILSCFLVGCASINGRQESQLNLSQDTYITEGSNPRVLRKQGETVSLDTHPVLLEAPGYVGMLLIPMKGSVSQLQPILKPIDEWSGDILEKTLNAKLNELVEETNQIQVLLSSKKEKEAFERIELLQRKYPKISYLNFFRASALFMMGEREKAKYALEIALKAFPDHANARSFYQSLGGAVPPGADRQPSSAVEKGSGIR